MPTDAPAWSLHSQLKKDTFDIGDLACAGGDSSPDEARSGVRAALEYDGSASAPTKPTN